MTETSRSPVSLVLNELKIVHPFGCHVSGQYSAFGPVAFANNKETIGHRSANR